MAKPVTYRVFTPADAREELKRKIDAAPAEHAEAILSAYRLLEEAHRSGALELVRGALAAQDSIVTHIADVASRPEMVHALRNLLVLGKLLGTIEPAALDAAMGSSGEDEKRGAPPTLFALLRRMNTADARRGINVAAGLLSALGALGAATRQPRK